MKLSASMDTAEERKDPKRKSASGSASHDVQSQVIKQYTPSSHSVMMTRIQFIAQQQLQAAQSVIDEKNRINKTIDALRENTSISIGVIPHLSHKMVFKDCFDVIMAARPDTMYAFGQIHLPLNY
jgi:hypothetical protein